MSADTLAERIREKEICKHPFVWPDGDCVQCGVLATTMPGHTEPAHIMVPRKFAPLLSAAEQAAKEMPSHDDIKKILGNGWKGFKLNDEDDLDFVIGQIRLAIIKCQAIRNRE